MAKSTCNWTYEYWSYMVLHCVWHVRHVIKCSREAWSRHVAGHPSNMSQLSQLTQALSQNSTFAEVGSLSADMTDAFSTWKDEVCNKQNGYVQTQALSDAYRTNVLLSMRDFGAQCFDNMFPKHVSYLTSLRRSSLIWSLQSSRWDILILQSFSPRAKLVEYQWKL